MEIYCVCCGETLLVSPTEKGIGIWPCLCQDERVKAEMLLREAAISAIDGELKRRVNSYE